jgi:hypothetical protein
MCTDTNQTSTRMQVAGRCRTVGTRTHSLSIVAALVFWTASVGATCIEPADPWLVIAVAIREGDLVRLGCVLSDRLLGQHDPEDLWEDTPLHLAARHDQATVVRHLIGRGAARDARNAADQSPLQVAIAKGATSAAIALIEGGAAVDSADADGKTPLFWAVAKGDAAVVQRLLQQGADADRVVSVGMRMERMSIKAYAAQHATPEIRKIFEER